MHMPNSINLFVKMRINRLFLAVVIAFLSTYIFVGCDDGAGLGSSLVQSEVAIEVDSAFTVTGYAVVTPVIDARSTTQLIGRISVPEYGDLECSFVTELMPAKTMSIADSIGVKDVVGMKLKLRTARGEITGDSLAPQQLQVFSLTKSLPHDITNAFDPEGYYNPSSPIATKNYTASAISKNDTLFFKETELQIGIDMPLSLAKDLFTSYRTNPEIFAWPDTFAEFFPGLFIKPSFGRGCIVNVRALEMCLYYNYKGRKVVMVDGKSEMRDTLYRDSVTLLSSAPEILSSNNISLNISDKIKNLVSEGKLVIMSPAGYNAKIRFPAQDILDKYYSTDFNLAVINNLTLTIPVEHISNNYGIEPAPWLLMVKTKDLNDFFENNKVPDDRTSFWATYDSDKRTYTFTSMRNYILDLMKEGPNVEPEDMDFTLVPVRISTESGGSSYNPSVYVSACTPYLSKPSMCILNLDRAVVKFTFSRQSSN